MPALLAFPTSLYRCALAAVLWGVFLGVGEAQAGVTAQDIVETAKRLDSSKVDTRRVFAADGQSIHRHGLSARFDEGRFFPVEREDGRVVALIFEGAGELQVALPNELETQSWQLATNHAPLTQPFSAAVLRFTDSSGTDLQGERAWEEVPATNSAFRLFENRKEIHEHPAWTKWHPGLVIDQLMDLYGGGHVGGHLLAEFRLPNQALGGRWLSYFHNPRGALLPGETTALYRLKPQGAAPPELLILASWGDSAEARPWIDVKHVDLDVSFPTTGLANRNLLMTEVEARIDLEGRRPEIPVKAAIFDLAPERPLCWASPDQQQLRIRKSINGDGKVIGAIHRKGKLFVALGKSLQKGETARIELHYNGPLTQGIKGPQPDTYFSELGPWAWYPRNPHLDRHGSSVSAHLPRFMSAVGPGDLVEERKDKDRWHFRYEEATGIKNITLAVGDLVHSKDKEQGTNPRIISWVSSPNQELIRGAAESTRGLVDFITGLWGPYPYSTLHLVETMPYPSTNWLISGGGTAGNWTCLPRGLIYPFQGFVETPSGLMNNPSPVTAPVRSPEEGRAITQLSAPAISGEAYLRVVSMARQWWGHMVPAQSYRDRWIGEALAHWTGLLYLRASQGNGALKEQLSRLRAHLLASELAGGPVVLGDRLGPDFPLQIWARGPLIVNWLVNRVQARPFFRTISNLINRSSGPGVTTAAFVEAFEGVLDERATTILERNLNTLQLPSLRFNTAIDKKTGELRVAYAQDGTVMNIDLPIEVIYGPKRKQTKLIRVSEAEGLFMWTPPEKPKRIVVDPMGTSLVRGLERDKDLPLDAEEPKPTEEETP